MKNCKNAGLPILGCHWRFRALLARVKEGQAARCWGLWARKRVPVGKSLAKPGFRPGVVPPWGSCQRRRYGGRMPLERGGKLAWNQRQGIAVADLTGQPRWSLPPSTADHLPGAVNSTPPLASSCVGPAIFSDKSQFDALSGTPFGTVWNGFEMDRCKIALWAPIQRFYGGRGCGIQPVGEPGLPSRA